VAAVVLLTWPAAHEAQQASSGNERSISPALVFYDLTRSKSQTPKSAVALSAMVGRSLGTLLRARAAVGLWASLPAGDDLSICLRLPDGGCAPDPVVPTRLWMGEVQGLARILPVVPLYAVAGLGIAFPQGQQADSLPSSRTTLRAGLELGDGRRWRGLRLQFSRVLFSDEIRSLRSGNEVGLRLRL
jgi:hypothetical protein